MTGRLRALELTLCLCAGGFYLANVFVLRPMASGWLGWFLGCYANDIFAGLAMVAWLNLLLGWAGIPLVRAPLLMIPYLLACGFVWEVLAPLWNGRAVFDLWDFVAYQVGGGCYLLLLWRLEKHQIRPT